ncbi:MAG: 1,6-anhydro-N-acetylmuramyl-L-alanine amidase AmpD [Gammaproteobacteria bacterium]
MSYMAVRVNAETGWLRAVRRVLSPNCDDRPPGAAIELIVVHGISLPPGHYGGEYIDQLFTNRLRPEAHPYFRDISHLRVSAHVLIHRDGSLTQYVPFHKRAWHAGESCFEGRPYCNDFSIGIELQGSDDEPYAAIQYQELARLAVELMAHWPLITAERIVGHCHVAPGRKTDPGPSFDWCGLREWIENYENARD